MKRYVLLLLVFCLGGFVASAEEISEDVIKKLKRSVKIGSVTDSTIRDDYDEKVEIFKFYTSQNEADEFNFRVRVAVEMTDKQKNTYVARMMRGQGEVDSEYTGEDTWKFQIPHGDLERPKITAYVIQYGIEYEGEFIILAEDYDDVDTLEELLERSTDETSISGDKGHTYTFRDGDEGVSDSIPN